MVQTKEEASQKRQLFRGTDLGGMDGASQERPFQPVPRNVEGSATIVSGDTLLLGTLHLLAHNNGHASSVP